MASLFVVDISQLLKFAQNDAHEPRSRGQTLASGSWDKSYDPHDPRGWRVLAATPGEATATDEALGA